MSECIICNNKFEKNILFEDDNVIVMLAIEPAVNGHIQIFSKKHFAILEEVAQETLNNIIASANKMSIILFEALKVHGTNIIINNGVPAGQKIPHFSIDILPRRNDDNLKLDWTLKQATPESLDSMQRIIGEGMSIHDAAPLVMDKKSDVIRLNRFDNNDTNGDETTSKNNNGDNNISNNNNHSNNTSKSDKPKDKVSNYHHQLFERIP